MTEATASRHEMIDRYEAGPRLLREALAEVPAEAVLWRPAPGKWSAHEVVLHCADSETIACTRIRYVVGEAEPLVVGYDENRWAQVFDYHALPLEPALAQVEQVRAWTVPFLRGLPASAWERSGRHTELHDRPYTAMLWLKNYAEHLEIHARQIRRNLAAWREVNGG